MVDIAGFSPLMITMPTKPMVRRVIPTGTRSARITNKDARPAAPTRISVIVAVPTLQEGYDILQRNDGVDSHAERNQKIERPQRHQKQVANVVVGVGIDDLPHGIPDQEAEDDDSHHG